MKELEALLCSNPKFKFVTVKFATNNNSTGWSKQYTYKTLLNVKPEDLVVVEVSKDSDTRFKCGTVIEIKSPFEIDYSQNSFYSWIVDVINVQSYQECIEQEANMMIELNKAQVRQIQEQALTQLEENIGTKCLNKLKHLVENL